MAGPPMMPGGGGQNGGDIANQLMELVGPILQSPKGQQMAQAIMSQMGGAGGGGGGMDPMAMMQQMMGGGGGGGMPQGAPPPQAAPPQGGGGGMPSTEDEMAMVQQQMNGGGGAPPGGGGGTGMNSDGPTPQEIQLLKSNPSPRNMQNFDKLFGPGAAQAALGGGDMAGGPSPAPQGGSTYEDDVKGAMDDADGDEGDHEYR